MSTIRCTTKSWWSRIASVTKCPAIDKAIWTEEFSQPDVVCIRVGKKSNVFVRGLPEVSDQQTEWRYQLSGLRSVVVRNQTKSREPRATVNLARLMRDGAD